MTIGAIAAAVVALNIALATNPFILATAAVIGLAVAFNKLVDAAERINSIGGLAARILGGLAMPVIGNVASIIGGLTDLIPSGPAAPTPAPPTSRIPRLAEGGIVSSPTLALIGEAGPEAVVPLDRMNNGGGITINVTGGLATSAEIGESVVNALRAYSRSAGPLQ
jgi:phage-related minor tail protein